MEVKFQAFLMSALGESEWPASHPACFTPMVRGPSTDWVKGEVGPRTDMDMVEKIQKTSLSISK
jgi:hypothetical protein